MLSDSDSDIVSLEEKAKMNEKIFNMKKKTQISSSSHKQKREFNYALLIIPVALILLIFILYIPGLRTFFHSDVIKF